MCRTGTIRRWDKKIRGENMDDAHHCHLSHWRESGKFASCEVIVAANQVFKHMAEEGLFAVTSAHLLLGDNSCKRLKAVDPSQPIEQSVVRRLDVEREKVYSRIDRHIYKLHVGQRQCDLANPSLLCYQYWQRNNREQVPYQAFLNDIALFPIDSGYWEIAKTHQLILNRNLPMVTDVTAEILKWMAESGQTVEIKDMKGIMVPMAESLSNKKIGFNISFKLTSG